MLLQLGHLMGTAPSHSPTTVSLADEEAVRRILVDTLFGLWATVNNLSRLRPSRHDRYRVTVFGSARPEPGHWVYEEVKQMCSALSAMNCDIITGWRPGSDAGRQRRGAGGADKPRGAEHRHPGALAVRTRSEPFRRASLRARDVLHPAASLRAHVRRVHRCPGWPRNAAGIDDDLAALTSAS